ncbi:MAG: hypothetical protein HUU50_18210, partial [Candidatus Brocadiae bacterium]|nr:hypothetical protein [Candidatus Brocadiia bacterium]
CYGNQALILKAWGKLDEAMTLLKKQEQICEQLGDKAGLSSCYNNQAVLLGKQEKEKEAEEMWQRKHEIKAEIAKHGPPTEDAF